MSSELGPVGEVDGTGWRDVLGLVDGEAPVAVIVEGTWWREQRTRERLARLSDVRELGVPDVHLGSWAGRQLIYACPYGAPRTAEIVHIAALVGARLAVQLGSCGVVGEGIAPGDVIVPTAALGLDGVTAHYQPDATVASTSAWSERAVTALEGLGVRVHQGPSVTWPTLFNQPLEWVRAWQREGYLGVDMETATTFAVAHHFGAETTAMLVAWDEVLSERSFLDPLPDDQAAAFKAAEEALFVAALELIENLGDQRHRP